MFFVSEEFLRKYEEGQQVNQTIDSAVKPGEGLFEHYESKADWKKKQRGAKEES